MKYWHINCLRRQAAGALGYSVWNIPELFLEGNGIPCGKQDALLPDTGPEMPLTVKVWILRGDLRYSYIRKEKQM